MKMNMMMAGNLIIIIMIGVKIKMNTMIKIVMMNMRISDPSEDFLCDKVDAAVLRP